MNGAEGRLREEVARIIGNRITEQQVESMRVYLDLLAAWNSVHRLVGSSDRDWMAANVILDSLLFLKVIPRSFGSLLDIGSGAGIPGIPIRIVRPEISLVMVESRRRSASFLASAVRAVGLSGTRVVQKRAEAMIEDGERFDVVVARCAGKPRAVLDLGAQLVLGGGMVVVAGSPARIDVPGSRWVRVVNPSTGSPRHFLVREATAPAEGEREGRE